MKDFNSRNPQISVVMPTYNRYDTLAVAIDSVLAQTFEGFEFIIVDDGSTDNTASLLQKYAAKDPRIKIITQINHGSAIARNNGVAASSGKYIALMDSDDACAVNRLQVQLDFLKEHPDVHATVCEVHDINNFHPGFVGTAGTRVLWNAGGAYKPVGLLKGGQGLNGLLGPSTLITKESFMEIGGYRPHDTIIEDMDFTLRYSAAHSAGHSHQLGKWAFMAGASLYLYTFPSSQKTPGNSNADPLKFAKRHIACYISQWCDYKGLPDPVAENKGLEEILKITESMPWRARYLIFASAAHLHSGIMVTQKISLNQSRGCVLDLLGYPWVIKLIILFTLNLTINLKNLLRPLKPWVSPLLRKLRLLKTT